MQNKDTIYGINPVLEAITSGKPLNKVLIQKDTHNERIGQIIGKLKKMEIPFQFVPREKLNRLTPKAHQGIIALASPVEFESIEAVLPQLFEAGINPLITLLDGVTDVRNLGAIARSAECLGVHALVIPAQGSALINADAMKASAGALNQIRICREINFLKSAQAILHSGLQLIACTEKASKTIEEIDFSIPTALVFGAEDEGIQSQLLSICSDKAAIPMAGNIKSLNVSVAAGIAFYETLRQRKN